MYFELFSCNINNTVHLFNGKQSDQKYHILKMHENVPSINCFLRRGNKTTKELFTKQNIVSNVLMLLWCFINH